MLSGGEKQRVGFARVLYRRPAFAFMDEATSALTVEAEAELVRACMDRGTTLVSVSHRESLTRMHHDRLVLDGEGSFSVEVGESAECSS